jgi:hypothetical protein
MATSSRARNGDGRLKRVCLAGCRSIETFFRDNAGISPDGWSRALRAELETVALCISTFPQGNRSPRHLSPFAAVVPADRAGRP